MKILLTELRKNKKYHQLLSSGQLTPDGTAVEINDVAAKLILENEAILVVEEKPEVVIWPSPVPEDQWPAWAKQIARFKNGVDRGVGDTAERIFGKFGGESFKFRYKQMIGSDCGCGYRKELWNHLYPYVDQQNGAR